MCTYIKLNILKIEQTICIKMGLGLNNLQMLICQKSNQPTNHKGKLFQRYGIIILTYLWGFKRNEKVNNKNKKNSFPEGVRQEANLAHA